MRLHFQTTPADVYVALAYAVVVSGFLIATGAGSLLGIPLVIVVPGYLAMVCLLPRADQGDWVLRTSLSVGFSLALVAFLGIALNFTAWGITFTTVTASDLALSVALGLLAYRRRMAVPAAERLEVTLDLHGPRWDEYSLVEKALTGLVVVILIVAIPLFARSLTQPRPAPGFTELYLLGPTGNFSGYPSVLNASQPATVRVVVTNREGVPANYTLRVDLVGVTVVFNATSGTNETLETNRTTLSTFSIGLADGGSWNESFPFSIASVGTWQVQFLLFRGGDLSAPYRFARLDIAVPA